MFETKSDEVWTEFHFQVNDLLIEEKAARQVSDHIKLGEICSRVVSIFLIIFQLQLAFDNKRLDYVRELFLMLVKRRGQAKKPIVDMVEMCQGALFEKLPNRDEKYSMLRALREASEGKMFLEREYANCTTKLCEFLE